MVVEFPCIFSLCSLSLACFSPSSVPPGIHHIVQCVVCRSASFTDGECSFLGRKTVMQT